MNDEIREIFDTKLYFDLEEEDYIKIKNYITNLQQENERLKEQSKKDNHILGCNFASKDKYKQRYEDYKLRVEKAVEYIKNDMPYLQETDKEYEDMNGDTYFTYKEWDDTVLLNILQNGSDEK